MWVIKLGGNAAVNAEAALDELAAWAREGRRWVVIHGISKEADALGEALGHPPQYVTSVSGFTSRYTDERTRDILLMAYGRVNAHLVAALRRRGVHAIGLRGIDGGLLQARRKEALRIRDGDRIRILRGDYSGAPIGANAELLRGLLRLGLYPVIAPMSLTPEGEIVNVDGDRAAAAIAAALQAEGLIFLTGAPGLLRAFPDETTRVAELRFEELEEAMAWAQGRMRHKLLAAREALQSGLPCVWLADGRRPAPLTAALRGEGTRITAMPLRLPFPMEAGGP
ncbi:[LysW]-aminoadipate kinase [Thermoflexus sp.]|nr:[LysW]-aminoadipate kinase [Thermoflexus sp.]MCS6963509.1 [LysW]-aminoadipate kinase [Thermoflexus sp.]MCX7689643.1 [LysW]-aminoadipate kinase [Thermoflexus sp.]MDW8184781.1 [LysW]-aminoadipate kinase [Anaerolineae bacterium]